MTLGLKASDSRKFLSEQIRAENKNLRIATINHDLNNRHTLYTYGKVVIKKNAWIGMNATICPGVTIGKYAVVGAGAVVTKDIPDYAVAGGVPAKVIRMQNPSDQNE